MSSATNNPGNPGSIRTGPTAAWRISIWSTLVFALGTTIAFVVLHHYVARVVEQRSDAWLLGEVSVLSDVAVRTPRGALYDRIVDEIAELATKEVPADPGRKTDATHSVFFIETGSDHQLKLWVGSDNSAPYLDAIGRSRITPGHPVDVAVRGFSTPYRVVQYRTEDGNHIYLGMSERNDRHVLGRMRAYFFAIFIGIVLLGFALAFFTTKRLLRRVQRITETAARIDQDNLQSRVPTTRVNDEVAQLAGTLNHMLDRIARAVHQLHTITDSLAHDLRSPITAIRGKMELALLANQQENASEPIVSALEELDRLSDLLTRSLDVAEAEAGALRLHRSNLEVGELIQTMIELYEPSLAEHDLQVALYRLNSVTIQADPGLLHRMMANLFDNAIRHLPRGSSVSITLESRAPESRGAIGRLTMEDDGPGFPTEVRDHLFDKYAKGLQSTGNGLGLAFVEAVVTAHGGTIAATNTPQGGARLMIDLPLAG
uniref:histidine kinase n=1 Tax=mine drainage metagenome TaxID=410659 RepID=E6PXD6_9ZZZZ